MTETRATLIGAIAVLLWGALALFTTWTGSVPPFQLVCLTFSIAFLLALSNWIIRRENPRKYLRHPLPVWIFGIGGLFGYHAFYFLALKNAPVVEASLIAYLWPLLIVLFSALLPGERLRWFHIVGTLAGLSGTVVLVTDGGSVSFKDEHIVGYAAACACALTWSGYSVLSRRFEHVPTDTVGWFCGATAVLGGIASLIFETPAWPADPAIWLGIFLLGLGPVGAAFFVWDVGMKRGNIRVLGAVSYSAPMISTLFLIAFSDAMATGAVWFACLAIVGGAILAAKNMIFAEPKKV
ncbi:MAG: EamA family transporter [Alphaproteobacteria bacterium]|jgi:drug/metabolite transporter (DMT)-like permease|nr:EamA family transporter [Alphaproteobacteria bacterium]